MILYGSSLCCKLINYKLCLYKYNTYLKLYFIIYKLNCISSIKIS